MSAIHEKEQAGKYFDFGGSVLNVQHPSLAGGGAKGDYDPVTGTGTDDTAAFLDAISKFHTIDLGNRIYKVTAAVDLSNKRIVHDGAEIHAVGLLSEPLVADGSLGAYSVLGADAVKGENRFTCAAIALVARPGDIVKLTSTADFSDGEVGIKQAEMVSVRNITGSVIYTNETLNDSYTVANGAKAAIVTLARVRIDGRLKVVQNPALVTSQTRGVRFRYAQVRGELEIFGARATAASFNNCWKDDVTVDVGDGAFDGTGTSYGISIQNATMYGRYRGVLSGCRLAVSCTGDGGADSGSSWENHASITGHTGLGVGVANAHSNTGSIYWDDCTVVGGAIYDLNGVLQPTPVGGIGCGARRNYIRNLTVIKCVNAVQMSTNCTTPVEEIVIDGVHMVDCEGSVFAKGTGRPGINSLVIRNVHGNCTNKLAYALDFFSGNILAWQFENINLRGCGLAHFGPSVANVPSEFRVETFTVKGPSDTEATITVRGIFQEVGATGPTIIRLRNGPIENMNRGMDLRVALTQLELTNVHFNKSLQHILLADAITFGHIKIRGGSFRGSRHGSGSQGSIIPGAATVVTLLEADGVEIDTDPYLIGNTSWSSISTLMLGRLKTHAGLTGFVRSAPATMVEVLSGSLQHPRLIRTIGSPNGVVTAPQNCMCQNASGGAGVRLYINTNGGTAWTAYGP